MKSHPDFYLLQAQATFGSCESEAEYQAMLEHELGEVNVEESFGLFDSFEANDEDDELDYSDSEADDYDLDGSLDSFLADEVNSVDHDYAAVTWRRDPHGVLLLFVAR
jgi:hypothetical protein